MHFKLKDHNGNIITPFINANHKPVVKLNGNEYEILEPWDDYDDQFMSTLIAEFDADPEVRVMIEESEKAIEQGLVYSTARAIQMIKNGEI